MYSKGEEYSTNLPFAKIEYKGSCTAVKWCGVRLYGDEKFHRFMKREVAERLHDKPGSDEFQKDLRGLNLTGLGKESLEEVLNAECPEERDWAVGESMAEAFLIRSHGVQFPWNMERDKRNPKASLPGADIVGFLPVDGDFRLALGEVKTSGDQKTPPQVMYGRSGLTNQIDELASDLGKIHQLLKWLHPRIKNTNFENAYNCAASSYFNSGNKAASLFGFLIRDTGPDKLDLENRGKSLCEKFDKPTSCELVAVYLPCNIADLLGEIREGGEP